MRTEESCKHSPPPFFSTATETFRCGPPSPNRVSLRRMSIESMPGQTTQANSEYVHRIDRVIDHLRGNLDRQVKLGELAKVACFSEFHFHRIFRAVSGE